MADINDINAAQTIKIVGSDSSGVEQTPVQSTVDGKLKVENTIADGFLLDALSRPRVTDSTLLYVERFTDSDHTFDWPQKLNSGATLTFDQNNARRVLTTNTTAASRVDTRSRRYIQYLPGRSFLFSMVTGFAAPKTNVIQEAGMFDEQDGLFFMVNGTTQNVVIRSSTSGSPSDTIIPRASWNIDKFDGTGPSGTTLDLTRPQNFVIDYSWYGFGRVRFGAYVAGKLFYCHEFSNLNLNFPFMQRGSLPISLTLRNTGTTSSSTSITQGSTSLVGEGSIQVARETVGISNGVTQVSVSTGGFSFPISVRLKSQFNKCELLPLDITLFTSSNTDMFFEVVANATVTGGTWIPQNESIAEYNVTATNITGGKVISSGYLDNNNNSRLLSLETQFRISYDTLNNVPDTLSIRVRSLSGNGQVTCALNLGETF